MKRLLTVIVVCLLVVGCGSKTVKKSRTTTNGPSENFEPPKDFVKHEPSSAQYEIHTPKSWRTKEDTGDFFHMVSPMTSGQDEFRENCNVTLIETERQLPLNAFYRTRLDQIQKNEDRRLNDSKRMTIRGQETIRLDFNRGDLRLYQYLMTEGTYFYLISCGTNQSVFDSHSETFETIAGSFNIL